LFPLRTVLFPKGTLPLRIFETRYLEMVSRCMRENQPFGVVLIHQGTEVGTVHSLATVGTSARVVDFDRLPDGLLGIVARGERRFRLLQHELLPDGLHVGTVEWLEDASQTLDAEAFPKLRQMLIRALDELGDNYPCGERELDDALWVSGQLGQLLPLPLPARQALLELPGPLERLARM
jgi:uncharacterized protein